eukprot:1144208-Pelagomonas_calceolata.AAC.9
MGIMRVIGSRLHNLAARSFLVFDSTPSGNKLVSIHNRTGMKFASKFIGVLAAKSQLFKLVKGVLSVAGPTNTQKDSGESRLDLEVVFKLHQPIITPYDHVNQACFPRASLRALMITTPATLNLGEDITGTADVRVKIRLYALIVRVVACFGVGIAKTVFCMHVRFKSSLKIGEHAIQVSCAYVKQKEKAPVKAHGRSATA